MLFSIINRRIIRLDTKINENKSMELEDDYIAVAIDSTGIKVTNRGQWMRDKWNNKKRLFENPHTINVSNRKILSMKVVTDEHVHDGKACQNWLMTS